MVCKFFTFLSSSTNPLAYWNKTWKEYSGNKKNKLWEQDIILREQNKKNSRMALISHSTLLAQAAMLKGDN
jgi:hypothetical protein